jgi:hypothetical protein
MTIQKDVPYYVLKCVKFLQNRVPNMDIHLIDKTSSYITGLKYHKYKEVPSKNRIYLCLPEQDNKVDPTSVGIYSNQIRIGFMPGFFSQKIHKNLKSSPESTAVLCYCFGHTTQISAQCVYLMFELTPVPTMDTYNSQKYIQMEI